MPASLIERIDDSPVYAPRFARGAAPPHFELAHQALSASRRIVLDYARDDGSPSARTIRPLGLYYWGKVWTLAAWCELRDDFRSFRLDRMRAPALGAPFAPEADKTLEVFLARMRARADAPD